MDGIVAEMFKSGGISIIECLLRIFNGCMYIVRYTKGKVTEENVLIIEE